MNFQIFKKLSILGRLLFSMNLLVLTKKNNLINSLYYYLNKFLFLKFLKLKIFYFFFFICIKYIMYGNNFVYYYIYWYLKKYLLDVYSKKNNINVRKKNKLINIIKINNLKIFKIYSKMRRNLIRKYSLNLTRKIVERNSFKKLLKSILL
ncbi:hypothetical protein [Candidatus Carsonella ruddii]|uniref:hypothetical protein n=1 Tax=Carsonella ruddii TaxID=114186 RepID=UPI003D48439F